MESLKPLLLALEARAARLLGELEPYAVKYEGYTLCLTWVLNKVKKKYYYYYLKSKTRKPTSIYLGHSPVNLEALHKLRRQGLRTVVQRLRRIMRLAEELNQVLDIVEAAEQLLTWIKQQDLEVSEQESKNGQQKDEHEKHRRVRARKYYISISGTAARLLRKQHLGFYEKHKKVLEEMYPIKAVNGNNAKRLFREQEQYRNAVAVFEEAARLLKISFPEVLRAYPG